MLRKYLWELDFLRSQSQSLQKKFSLTISLGILTICHYSPSQQLVYFPHGTQHSSYCLFLLPVNSGFPSQFAHRGKDYSGFLHQCSQQSFCHIVGVQIFMEGKKTTKNRKYCILSAEHCFSQSNKGKNCFVCQILIKNHFMIILNICTH